MENSRYRWVIVAAGGLLGCVAIGGMFSLPVFLQPIARDTGWSVTGISSAMTIGFLAMAFTSMIWGTLSDRLGPLPVVLTGSVGARGKPGAGEPRDIAGRISVHLRADGRRRSTAAIFAPMMALRHRLVRYPSQPCGVAGLGRHGHGADDHVAARGLAGLEP